MIRKLNRTANIKIDTPAGKTKEIKFESIVKQGTLMGPQLCCVNSAKVNQMKNNSLETLTPTITIEAMIYVDDIMGAGSRRHIEKIGKCLGEMERKKKYTFNVGNGNSHYMVIKTGRDKIENVEIEVEKGMIETTEWYKYLGNVLTSEGTVEGQIKKVRNKVKGMVKEVKRIGEEGKVGKMDTSVRLLLWERIIIPTLIFNL